jgi:hypothetical protein
MNFHLTIVLAAIAAWLAGAAWYAIFGRTWIAALGIAPDKMAAMRQGPQAYLPFAYAFVAELVMAWMLAGLLQHLAPSFPISVRNGVISGLHLWVAFVLTVMLVNNSFAHRDWRLLMIDGGHWLVVMVLMGAILGAMI